MLFSWPLMCAIQEISAASAASTGRGNRRNLKKHYPNPVVYSIVTLLLVANVINIGADLGAMGAALKAADRRAAAGLCGRCSAWSPCCWRSSPATRANVSILKWLTLSCWPMLGWCSW